MIVEVMVAVQKSNKTRFKSLVYLDVFGSCNAETLDRTEIINFTIPTFYSYSIKISLDPSRYHYHNRIKWLHQNSVKTCLLYCTGSKPAGDKFFLSEHTFTREWFPQRFLLTDLSEVVNPTGSKSISHGSVMALP